MESKYSPCPRCGARTAEIDGWREYGDQLVEITVIGCWECGWNEEMEEDEQDEGELI